MRLGRRSIRAMGVSLVGTVVFIACGSQGAMTPNADSNTVKDSAADTCPIGQDTTAMGRYSDDCVKRIIPWHVKGLDMSKDYVLLTREINSPANPTSLASIYLPRKSNSALPDLTVTVSDRSPLVPLPDLEREEMVQGVMVEIRSNRADQKGARGAVWLDGGIWYALIARRGGDANAVDAMLISWVSELLAAS